MAIFHNLIGKHTGWRTLAAMLCAGSAMTAQAGEPGRMLEMTTWNGDGVVHFCVRNLSVAAVTATIDLNLFNLKGSTNFPCTATIPGKKTVELFTLNRIARFEPCDFNYTYSATIGSVQAVHDDTQVYSLPYTAGTSFRVSQGYHGSFSHTGPDEFAIDWDMPVGTPVLAARAGLVVKSRDDSDQGGPDRKYLAAANCVLIQHSDGTVGAYGHLKQGGNTVKVGDRVKAGDEIGLSGNTGFTQSPHLHFSVFKTKNGQERLSLSVKFRTAEQKAVVLETDQVYQAAPATAPQYTTIGSATETVP